MDKEVIIRVENLSKRYFLGRSQSSERYTALRDILTEKFKAPWRFLRRQRGKARQPSGSDEFWALRDVNLEVRRGEVMGVIGRNGAGKSTLLKILSRITEPTTGRVSLRGRVASLLEVGTGFHPELTGRENIFLNGAILGMSRREIKAKFDEIVAFAEVERFLDTPVKRYSSGMYVRLAFAVAAHLEPEILIVDEVLAVGDAEFQKKCLGKMGQVAKGEGRTVIFVSHNMGAVSSLCTTGVHLSGGRVTARGSVAACVANYLSSADGSAYSAPVSASTSRPTIRSITVDNDRLAAGHISMRFELLSPHPLNPPIFGLVLYNEHGAPVYGSNLVSHPDATLQQPMESGAVTFDLEDVPLQTGLYSATFFLGDHQRHYVTLEHAVSFSLVNQRPPAFMHPIDSNGSLNWPAKWQRVS